MSSVTSRPRDFNHGLLDMSSSLSNQFVLLTIVIACLTVGEFSTTASGADPGSAAATTRALREESPATRPTDAFIHPGLLSNEEDFRRMKAMVDAGKEPWKSDWEKLIANRHASLKWQAHPAAVIFRGKERGQTEPQNYAQLFNDTAAAYSLALRWRISGDSAYGGKAVEILNAWAATLTKLSGSTDVCLAGGIYGYQFANAAEIMRSFDGWDRQDFRAFRR